MTILSQFADSITRLIRIIEETQQEPIARAAQLIAQAIADKRRVHVLGTGAHSMMAAEEVLHGAKRSVSFERMPGYGIAVLNANNVGSTEKEVMVLVNAYGIDPMSLDVAFECHRRGITVIAVTSSSYESIPKDSPLRHASRKNLYEVADVFIDCGIPLGDAMISVNGFEQMVGSASTILNCFIMNALEGAIVEQLMLLGIDPPVFMSANLPGGDEANKRWETEYGSSARYML